ncbi:MAG TPA: hypothetical protein VGC15_11015, partial [Acetobacteraceae bacterium]
KAGGSQAGMVNPAHPHHYVSAVDGKRKHLLAGPYSSPDEAKSMVRHVAAYAEKGNPRAAFMAWGTASSATPEATPLGKGWKGEPSP